jgi:hypothetical protein
MTPVKEVDREEPHFETCTRATRPRARGSSRHAGGDMTSKANRLKATKSTGPRSPKTALVKPYEPTLEA